MSGLHARFALQRGGFALDVEFTAPARGISALYGPSGSGKTSVLRCVAGLERAPGGFLKVDDEFWQQEDRGHFLPPHRRPVGYVFQEPSLFDHLSVRGNLEYGWKRTPTPQRRVAFDQAVSLLGVAGLLDRRPAGLSGGERQRVAIARALLTSPRLLLMDEPLAALDAASKADILPYLERLHQELAMPVLYVSHSPEEVARLADYMIYLNQGKAQAAGPLSELLTRLDLSLSHGDQAAAMLDAQVAGHDEHYHLTYLDFAGGRISLPRADLNVGQAVRVSIRARDVSLTLAHQTQTSILNIFPAHILEIAHDTPAQVMVRLEAGGHRLLARVTRKSLDALDLAPGKTVYVQIKSAALAK